MVEVMTEKAAVEVPAPVGGRVVSTTGAPGDMVPVGAELIVIETGAAAGGPPATRGAGGGRPAPAAPPVPAAAVRAPAGTQWCAPRRQRGAARGGRIATSPAIRRRAHEAGIDLQQVSGSGPNGRIVTQGPRGVCRAPRRGARASAGSAQGSAGQSRTGRGDRGDQGHRAAARDRAAHERGQAQHPPLRLCRGARHHRARVAAAPPEPHASCRRRRAHLPAVSRRWRWCGC